MMKSTLSLTRGIASFLLLLPRPLALGIVAVVIGFVAFGAFGAFRVYSYTQNDPTFCRSCHTMEKAWDRWATSEHSKVNCHSCHEASPVASFEQVVKYAVNQPDDVSKHALVNDEACKTCHESGNGKWKQIADTAGHQVHVEDQNLNCLKCHSVTLHRFAPPEKICLACHGDQTVKTTAMAERYCLDCHNFLRENSPLRPQRQDCLKCHEAQTQKEVHWPTTAPMQFQCAQCHQPHKAETSPVATCQSCHTEQQTKGKHAVSAHTTTSCSTCHKPHEWKVTQRETCTTCHQNKVEHNAPATCNTCHSFRQ